MNSNISGPQTCLSRYPNQGSDCLITFSILRRKKNKPEQHCGFGSALPTEESYISPTFGTTELHNGCILTTNLQQHFQWTTFFKET